ncbi:MAG TPA: T9SS type A sorting domain-containing protein [Bacteroidales bacterium]|nr:T9SS type A sorting domain-containing protein [Bacteroidales bacterium]
MKNETQLILMIAVTILLSPLFSSGQNIPVPLDKKMQMHHEMPGDKYLPNQFNNKLTSPPLRYKITGIFTAQVNVNASGQNILGDAGNEPNIAVNPLNPNRIVIGWRQFDDVNSNFRQAGWSYTSDAGQTWTFPGVIEPGIFRSDPVLDYDSAGNFYYNSLTSDVTYHCKVFKSNNGGAIWDAGVEAKGGDKQWMTIDRTQGVGSGNIYSSWTSYYSSCPPGFFTRSTDGGSSFEDCVYVGGNPYWGTMAVGNDGELYIDGSGQYDGIVVAKSTNAQIPGSLISWDFPVSVEMDGYITGNSPINPVGILGQANIDVDRSNGPGRGNVYVLASVQRLSNSDPGDVMFAKSTDGGQTWSFPIQINDDPGMINTQWFGTMSVAPNGRIDAVWLDTRDAPPGSDLSALYYSYSTNQGDTWSVNEKLSDSFDPHIGYPQQDKMGDYFDMESGNTGAHLAWANTLNGEEDVYYSFINPLITGTGDIPKTDNYLSVTCYPNPFRDLTTIRYQIPGEGVVKLSVYNVYGQEITTLVNKKQTAGIYNVTFSADMLPAGYYFCRLTPGAHSETTRLVIMK